MSENAQQTVIEFLGHPTTYGGGPVKRIDTHAASVFLAGERAIKVKRAVRFPFLNYSTLAKRKAACEAEIEVNRTFAPALYRRVVPITQEQDGTLRIGGTGEPVEWAVEMRRFDETQTLDHLAETGRIDASLADALGRAAARAHAAAPVVKEAHFISELAAIITQNRAELRASPELFPPDAVAALTESTRAAFDRVQPLLAERAHSGAVRRCHGDLHLGNIVLIDSAPVLFDAIEFNPALATGDVLYDLAFLLMDLTERGLQSAANIVLNRYLTERQRADDLDALAALPLFLSLRAAIRAKVTAARRVYAERQVDIEQSARDYFALAGKLLAPPSARLVAIGGLSGTGKSLLARELAADILPVPGAVLLRSDVERKLLFGAAELDRLPKEAYEPETTGEVYATLVEKAARITAAGHSVVVDAVFALPEERVAIAEAAVGVEFDGLFLTADLAIRLARLGARRGDASDADATVAQAQEEYDLGPMDWLLVDASASPDDTLRQTKKALGLT